MAFFGQQKGKGKGYGKQQGSMVPAEFVNGRMMVDMDVVMGMMGGKGYGGYGGYDDYGGYGGGKGFQMAGKAGGKGFLAAGKGGKSGGKGKKGSKGPPAKKAKTSGQALQMCWKMRLNGAYGKEHHKPPTKETLLYTTEEEGTGFICTLTSEKFTEVYQSEEAMETKKLAEESAAMLAMMGEFPTHYEEVPDEIKELGAQQAIVLAEEAPKEPKASKAPKERTAPKGQEPGSEQKFRSKLNAGLMIILGRPMNKEDIVTTFSETGGKMVCTLLLTCLEKPRTFTGKAVIGVGMNKHASQKQASQNAAETALKVMQKAIDEKMPDHELAKAAKAAAWAVRLEALKAEKAATEALA